MTSTVPAACGGDDDGDLVSTRRRCRTKPRTDPKLDPFAPVKFGADDRHRRAAREQDRDGLTALSSAGGLIGEVVGGTTALVPSGRGDGDIDGAHGRRGVTALSEVAEMTVKLEAATAPKSTALAHDEVGAR